MAGGKNIYNKNDTMDINELAALNEADFSPEYLEQLQQKIITNSDVANFMGNNQQFNEQDDSTLFEETPQENVQEEENVSENSDIQKNETEEESKENNQVEDAQVKSEESAEDEQKDDKEEKKHSKKQANVQNFDDNFIKKYKAKLNKQSVEEKVEDTSLMERSSREEQEGDNRPINEISNGNITERELTQEQIDYSKSLDFLDGNVKYSKYVIYIDPQNVDFMESLTVKERKNLINSIIREQDNIKITKSKFRIVQAIINHILIAIFTVAAAIPILYYTLNASLEATIDNYRRSQTNFQVLYKNHGKISNKH